MKAGSVASLGLVSRRTLKDKEGSTDPILKVQNRILGSCGKLVVEGGMRGREDKEVFLNVRISQNLSPCGRGRNLVRPHQLTISERDCWVHSLPSLISESLTGVGTWSIEHVVDSPHHNSFQQPEEHKGMKLQSQKSFICLIRSNLTLRFT